MFLWRGLKNLFPANANWVKFMNSSRLTKSAFFSNQIISQKKKIASCNAKYSAK